MKTKNINMAEKTVLVTGVAGFIGCNLAIQLMNRINDIRIKIGRAHV